MVVEKLKFTVKLLFFGRAITPSKLKIRFHARFFLAFYEDFIGKIKTNGELENLNWISVNEARNKKIADKSIAKIFLSHGF